LNRDRSSVPNPADKAKQITEMLSEIINNFEKKYAHVGIGLAQIVRNVETLLHKCGDSSHIGGNLPSLLSS
jgi:hypothetical protein